MDREQAIKFLAEDCVFSTPLKLDAARELWESRKAIVEKLSSGELPLARNLPLSAADLKAARKFRSKHPDAGSVVDFVRLNPMDLIVHQLWVSTAISGGYRDKVTPDKWLSTALLDPPSNSRLKSLREGDTIVVDLPHAEFFLDGPLQPDEQIRVSEADGFITVAVHEGRALLLRGYHRTFACAQLSLEAVNAPHGVLFGVSNQLLSIGSAADDILSIMTGPRPPRMADFFDDRFFLPVTLRKRRYQMRIHCEMAEIDEEGPQTAAEYSPPAVAPASGRTSGQSPNDSPSGLRNVDDILNEAMRHHKAGRIDEAVAQYERAHILRPDSAEAHNNLGVALVAQGRIDEAVTHYERAIALSPGHVSAHNNLGTALAAQGRIDEAIAHHERALAIDPHHAEARNELGNIFKYLGKFDDAMAQYGRAIALRPDYALAHFNRSEIKNFHPGDAELAALEALAGRIDLSADQAVFIHFALAKALEDCGDYRRAFEHLRKGNDLKRRQSKHGDADAGKLCRRLCTVFDRSLFERRQGEGDPSSVPIFVLGMPRSGSTLIEQILASHPQIHGAGELLELTKAALAVLNAAKPADPYPECVPALSGSTLRRIGETYLARLPALADGKVRIVDKSPANFLAIGLIRLILPNARIIHTVRDPIDTCVSCYSKLFGDGPNFSYDLAELGRYYRCYHELMKHWRTVLPPGALLDVTYEDDVDDH